MLARIRPIYIDAGVQCAVNGKQTLSGGMLALLCILLRETPQAPRSVLHAPLAPTPPRLVRSHLAWYAYI